MPSFLGALTFTGEHLQIIEFFRNFRFWPFDQELIDARMSVAVRTLP